MAFLLHSGLLQYCAGSLGFSIYSSTSMWTPPCSPKLGVVRIKAVPSVAIFSIRLKFLCCPPTSPRSSFCLQPLCSLHPPSDLFSHLHCLQTLLQQANIRNSTFNPSPLPSILPCTPFFNTIISPERTPRNIKDHGDDK